MQHIDEKCHEADTKKQLNKSTHLQESIRLAEQANPGVHRSPLRYDQSLHSISMISLSDAPNVHGNVQSQINGIDNGLEETPQQADASELKDLSLGSHTKQKYDTEELIAVRPAPGDASFAPTVPFEFIGIVSLTKTTSGPNMPRWPSRPPERANDSAATRQKDWAPAGTDGRVTTSAQDWSRAGTDG